MNEPFRMTHLHYPEIPPAEQAEAFLAWKRGEIIEYWGGDGLGWIDVQLLDSLARETIIRRKPQPSGRILATIQLPVSVSALCAIHKGLETQPEYKPLRTFMRQVGERLEIYECQP